ncbi:MAG: hypothetical protein V2G33_03410 [bacterium JZ-2024 1]
MLPFVAWESEAWITTGVWGLAQAVPGVQDRVEANARTVLETMERGLRRW